MADNELRYHPNPAVPLRAVASPRDELATSLKILVRGCPPVKPWPSTFLGGKDGGLFTGPTSIALLFLHLTRSHPSLDIEGKKSREWCSAYLACAKPSTSPDFGIGGCGITNPYLAFHAVSAAFTRNPDHVSALVKAFSDACIEPTLNEWMGGRAGALYLLRLVRAFVPSSEVTINGAMKPLIEQILANKPWSFRDQRYIGAVHGDIGIITQIVLSDSSYAARLEDDLSGILDQQLEDGNWPSRLGGDNSSNAVQFCHGAPGFVFSIGAIKQHFPALLSRNDAAIEKARDCVWKQGFLIKEPCLCHGATGNALALEGKQREHLLALATPAQISQGLESGIFDEGKIHDPWGLLWGEAGRAWSWAVLDGQHRGLVLGGVVGYTDV